MFASVSVHGLEHVAHLVHQVAHVAHDHFHTAAFFANVLVSLNLTVWAGVKGKHAVKAVAHRAKARLVVRNLRRQAKRNAH
jgi:hypothetical protein